MKKKYCFIVYEWIDLATYQKRFVAVFHNNYKALKYANQENGSIRISNKYFVRRESYYDYKPL